jgi:hypothetical protein
LDPVLLAQWWLERQESRRLASLGLQELLERPQERLARQGQERFPWRLSQELLESSQELLGQVRQQQVLELEFRWLLELVWRFLQV